LYTPLLNYYKQAPLSKLNQWIIPCISLELLILGYASACDKLLLLGFGIIALFGIGLITVHPEIGVILCIGIQFSRITEAITFFADIRGIYRFLLLFTFYAGAIKLFLKDYYLISFRNRLFYLSLLFFTLIFFSNLYASNTQYSLQHTVYYFKAWMLLLATVLFLRSWNGILYTLLFSFILNTIGNSYLIYSYVTNPAGIATLVLKGNLLRAKGFIFDPNFAALSSIVIAPLVIPFLKRTSSKILKIILLACLAISGLSVILTFSRMGIVTLTALGAYILFKEKHNKWVWLAVTAFCILVILFVPSFFFYRIENLLSGKLDLSSIKRLLLLRGGTQMFLDHPILGVGTGNFLFLSPNYAPGVVREYYAHNLYLEAAAEWGIVGFVILLLMIWKVLTYLWKIQKVCYETNKGLYYTTYAIELSFVGFLIGSLFLSTLPLPYFWGFVGLIIVIQTLLKKGELQLQNQYESSKTAVQSRL